MTRRPYPGCLIVHLTDPLRVQAAHVFAGDLAADRVPSVSAIRARLHVGQPRAGTGVPGHPHQRIAG
jgi:hypothetical protein